MKAKYIQFCLFFNFYVSMFFRWFLAKNEMPLIKDIHKTRLSVVEGWLHDDAPQVFSDLESSVICKNGYWNYFPLPSGKELKFEFVLPSVPLYVCVLGIESASWEEARLKGVDRRTWESTQADIRAIELSIPKLGSTGMPVAPRVLIFKWEDPINFFELEYRVRTLGIK